MKNKMRESESGQVLVILAIGIVALLGFAALAIDGGMFYSDRRYDQNAADSAALAGAGAAANAFDTAEVSRVGFSCDDSDVLAAITAAETAAIERASANNFTIDNDISDQNGVQINCADAGGEAGSYLDIQVLITTTTNTSFAQLFFSGDLENAVEAVTRVEPGDLGPFGDGYAILALGDDCKASLGEVVIDGAAPVKKDDPSSYKVEVKNGGIYSNGCLVGNGNFELYSEGGTFYVNNWNGKGTFTPSPPVDVDSLLTVNIDPPVCTGASNGKISVKSDTTLSPGVYDEIKVTSDNVLTLNPGLYCLSGSFSASAQSTVQVDPDAAIEDGVTIYLIDPESSFDVTGGATIQLRAPQIDAKNSGAAITGVVIFLADSGEEDLKNLKGLIKIEGNSISSYRGTVYAPTGMIQVGGNSEALGTLASQFVAYSVKVHGSSQVIIQFDNNDIYFSSEPSYLDLYK